MTSLCELEKLAVFYEQQAKGLRELVDREKAFNSEQVSVPEQTSGANWPDILDVVYKWLLENKQGTIQQLAHVVEQSGLPVPGNQDKQLKQRLAGAISNKRVNGRKQYYSAIADHGPVWKIAYEEKSSSSAKDLL